MRTIFGKLGIAAAFLICSAILLAPAAKADTITYTFTGDAGGVLAGASFTYVTSSFLSFDTGILGPTTSSGVFPVLEFDFINPNDFYIVYLGSGLNLFSVTTYSIGASNAGEHLAFADGGAGLGTLVITDSSSTTAPEPSSILMLAAGLVGLIGLAFFRRRKAQPVVA
jgi:hypothetical protein